MAVGRRLLFPQHIGACNHISLFGRKLKSSTPCWKCGQGDSAAHGVCHSSFPEDRESWSSAQERLQMGRRAPEHGRAELCCHCWLGELIPGGLIPLSAEPALLARHKNIYQPFCFSFCFVCSGSYPAMPVPGPCQSPAPPCPAMLLVVTLSPALGDTNSALAALQGSHSPGIPLGACRSTGKGQQCQHQRGPSLGITQGITRDRSQPSLGSLHGNKPETLGHWGDANRASPLDSRPGIYKVKALPWNQVWPPGPGKTLQNAGVTTPLPLGWAQVH